MEVLHDLQCRINVESYNGNNPLTSLSIPLSCLTDSFSTLEEASMSRDKHNGPSASR